MKYLCLIYDQEHTWNAMSPHEMDAVMGEYFSFSDSLVKGGQMLAGEALESSTRVDQKGLLRHEVGNRSRR